MNSPVDVQGATRNGDCTLDGLKFKKNDYNAIIFVYVVIFSESTLSNSRILKIGLSKFLN